MSGIWPALLTAAAVTLAIGLRRSARLRGYQFTAWIVAAVAAAMCYPSAFLRWGEFDLRNKWLILVVVQFVMFGMGTQMSLRDFSGVLRNPRGVIVGIVCHFSVMPLVGWGLTKVFSFPPEIAAGVILIGSCSSGLASNVMAYIARSNLALSVTVTAITTLVAPLLTPLLMQLLAGTLVEVKFVHLMVEIIKIVLVPIGAALVHDYLRTAGPGGRRSVYAAAGGGVLWLALLAAGGWGRIESGMSPAAQTWIGLAGFVAGVPVFGLAYHLAASRWAGIGRWMPVASMAGIVYFTLVTTAAGRDNLLRVGGVLFLVAVLHNAAGYFFGYWLSRGAGLDQDSARSVAFEVGLQNGGMATGPA